MEKLLGVLSYEFKKEFVRLWRLLPSFYSSVPRQEPYCTYMDEINKMFKESGLGTNHWEALVTLAESDWETT